jgi:hypothetical protein
MVEAIVAVTGARHDKASNERTRMGMGDRE